MLPSNSPRSSLASFPFQAKKILSFLNNLMLLINYYNFL